MSESRLQKNSSRIAAIFALSGLALFSANGNTSAFDKLPVQHVSAQANFPDIHPTANSVPGIVRPAAVKIAKHALHELNEGGLGWTQPVETTKNERGIAKFCGAIGRIFISFKGAKGPLKASEVTGVSVQPGLNGSNGEYDLTTDGKIDGGPFKVAWYDEAVNSTTPNISDYSTDPGHFEPGQG
ncbi:MAG TPA: hypothetical protein VLG47_06435, partial [Candidatus Saccharimonadales bacterium]|nr:hypothetical protein [Candidatus Saccharimonadales bacterium]